MLKDSLIKICLKEIEQKIKLEKTDPLSNSDCDYIAYLIEDKTKVQLGRSTIRRLWENKYKRFPQDSTLDALAQFLDYDNWQSFKKGTLDRNSRKRKRTFRFKFQRKYILVGVTLAIISFFIVVIGMREKQNPDIANNPNVIFECKQTGNQGLPKSVIFKYNIDSCVGDSFFIKQNWRKGTEEQVFKNHYYLTDIYYRPGVHWAKLISNSTVIKKIPVVINSDDWMGILEHGESQKDFTPLTRDRIMKNGCMTTTNDTFSYPVLKESYLKPLIFTNVKNFGEIDLNNCQIETSLKAGPSKYLCNTVLFGYSSKDFKSGYIKIGPIGCISNLKCGFGDTHISGKKNDLSKLGCDVTNWVDILIKIENKKVAVYLNQEPVIDTSYTKSMDGLQQLYYVFSGAGSVDYITIKSLDGDILYKDDFNDGLSQEAAFWNRPN